MTGPTWADELRTILALVARDNVEGAAEVAAQMTLLVEKGEQRYSQAIDTIEALVDANARLRRDLYLKGAGK